MTDDGNRTESATEPRSDGLPEWEVFLREAAEGPLRHVGSVTAATVKSAHEHAETLFGESARDVWLCKSDDVARFSTYSLVDRNRNAAEGRE